MSFVMFSGSQYFGMMIGDRRSIDNNDEIISDNEEKVIRINKNIVIGAGGAAALINILLRAIITNEDIENLEYIECVQLIREKCDNLSNEYFQLTETEDLCTNFGIMGFEKNGDIGFTVFVFLKDRIDMKRIVLSDEGDPVFVFLANGKNENLGKLFTNKFYQKPNYSINNLRKTFCDVLQEESKNDISINTKFIMDYIKNTKYCNRDNINIW